MKSPSENVVASLGRLRHDPDFVRVLDWLLESQHELDKRNRSMIDGVQLRMGQGAALAITEIIDAALSSNVVPVRMAPSKPVQYGS